MSSEQWIGRATTVLQDRYQRIRRTSLCKLAPTFGIKPALDASEAEYFVLGIEGGVFSIDDEGYAQSVVLPEPSGKGTQKKILQLFWHRVGKRYLFREGVCQLATLSALTLKYGWPIEQIQMEPSFPDYPHLAWAVDILLRNADGAIVACCEVKRDDREFEQLLEGFRHCCGRGMHSKDQCRFSKNHPKYELCAAIRPAYLMAASPGQQICFPLTYRGNGIAITAESNSLLNLSDLSGVLLCADAFPHSCARATTVWGLEHLCVTGLPPLRVGSR